jgi:hypothetical protein
VGRLPEWLELLRGRTRKARITALAAIALLALVGCNSAVHPAVSVIGSTPTPKPQSPTPVVTAAPTTGWTVYRDPRFPFEVPQPPGWQASVFYDTDHGGVTRPCAYTVYFFHTEIPVKAELMIETRDPESIFVGVSLNCPRFNPSANHWLVAEPSPMSFGGQPSTLYDNDGEGQVHRVTVAEFGGRQWQFTYVIDTPRGLKPNGFSALRRDQRHASPKGLPGPLYIPSGVVVAVQARPCGARYTRVAPR